MTCHAIFRLVGRDLGEIVGTVTCPADQFMAHFADVEPGCLAIDAPEDAGHKTHYMRRGRGGWTAVERPVLPVMLSRDTIAADDRDAAVLSGLPRPCTVLVDELPHTVEDGELVIRSPLAATYTIAIDHWPYLPWSAELVAA